MTTKNLIESISNIVEEECKKDSNVYGYGAWAHHITSVAKYAKLLAEKFGADEEIVEISALLHDYASVKDSSLINEHHIHGCVEAEKILNSFNYPKDRIDRIKECIFQHTGAEQIEITTKEALCVASADAIAHISQVPSLLHLVYYKRKLGIIEGAEWVSKKIERSWNKLCPEGKEIIKDKYDSAQLILRSHL